jgi:hypothetical protein
MRIQRACARVSLEQPSWRAAAEQIGLEWARMQHHPQPELIAKTYKSDQVAPLIACAIEIKAVLSWGVPAPWHVSHNANCRELAGAQQ